MKIFYQDHTLADIALARSRGITTSHVPPHLVLDHNFANYNGPPAYIFWDFAGGGNVAYAVPYSDLGDRRDNSINIFGLSSGVKYYGLVSRQYSRIWQIVEQLGGEYYNATAGSFSDIIDDIRSTDPDVLDIYASAILKMARSGVELPNLKRITIAASCRDTPAAALEEAHAFYGVPIVSYFFLPWLGAIAATDGSTFADGCVGRPVENVAISLDGQGRVIVAAQASRNASYFWNNEWHRFGNRPQLTGYTGTHIDGKLYITSRPAVATPPQPVA